jgi:hypothetical protein
MVALYRIDGVPLCVKIGTTVREMTPVLYWLENQIKEMLHSISQQNLDEASFKFNNMVIMLIPVSKTTVLGIIAREEASIYKLHIDIKTTCMKIGKLVAT